jgi:hypothetical protein
MVSISVPAIRGWGNQYPIALPGAHGPSLWHGGGLRALFFRPRSWRRPPPGYLWTTPQPCSTGGKARARTPT